MSTAASLPEHACWLHVVGRLHVEQGTALAGGRRHRRIELDCAGLTEQQLAAVFAVRTCCPSCGATVCPFRRRFGKSAGRADRPGRLYVALGCPLDVHIGCSRGKAASDATAHLAAAVAAHRPEPPTVPAPTPAPPPVRPPAPAPPAERREPLQFGLKGIFL